MTIFQDGRIGDYLAQNRNQGAKRTLINVPRVQVSAAAVEEAVTLAELKAFLKIDDDADNAALSGMISACGAMVEGWCGRALVRRTLVAWFDRAPDLNYIELPFSPISEITSVSTFADDDTETTFASSSYIADIYGEPGRVVLKNTASWPTNLRSANAVKVTYKAGYAAATSVPEGLKLAVKLLCAHFYEGRGAQMLEDQFRSLADAPPAVALALQPWIITRFGD